MTTFDHILPKLAAILGQHAEGLESLGPVLVNLDLNGRVRLVVNEALGASPQAKALLNTITSAMQADLGRHAYPPERAVLFEPDVHAVSAGLPTYPLERADGTLLPGVRVVNRLVTESNWASIEPVSTGVPRVVFFSIKGGVGRSTALAATAWALAQAGRRVLVLDLDLESPGLSSALLPSERRPEFGIADWLVEDLVGNGDAVLDGLWATSTLARDGEIRVVPAHGRDPGEYVSKLGRVWMPRVGSDGVRENWSQRLHRLIELLEDRHQPDVILIDSRAGIDEVASSCVTDLGAGLVLLFAIDGEQTWSGYRILFEHWRKSGVAIDIRERLQLVGAMIPDVNEVDYFDGLRERGADLFTEQLYDEVLAGQVDPQRWSFDAHDESAPHYPWAIRWHRGFAALRSLHNRLETVDAAEVQAIFGPLVDGVTDFVSSSGEQHGH